MIKMKQIYQRFFQNALLLAIIIPSILLSQDPLEVGCTDEAACNYDADAEVDDGSCEFESDCFGECGGSAIVDDCGVCDGGNVDMDCAGACNGDAVHDACGVCEGNGATNGLCPDGTPVLFQFSQSTLQAFYFFTDVTLDGVPIGSDDWVAAFKGDVCVGTRQWDTSNCGGGLCEIPAMGDDGSEYVIGYMQVGDIPTFKIYDASTGNVINAIPSLDVDPWSINGFSMNELLEAVIGCSDNTACNYNPNATESCSDCCTYIEEGECDCEGNIDLGCGCDEDAPSGCDNNCGSILENDDCGVCDGGNASYDCNDDCSGSLSAGTWVNTNPGGAVDSSAPTTVYASADNGSWNLSPCVWLDSPSTVDNGDGTVTITSEYGSDAGHACELSSGVFNGEVITTNVSTHDVALGYAIVGDVAFTLSSSSNFSVTITGTLDNVGADYSLNGSLAGGSSGGAVEDCAGSCGGTAVIDCNGDCNG